MSPLTPDQWRYVQRLLDQAIRQTLHEIADKLELEPDPLGLKKSMARGLRPDEPLFPPKRRDA